MDPRISVIIPTFNRARYVGQAIQSALAQDYENLEVIVADNASTDGTCEVVQRFVDDKRLTYIRNPKNLGMVMNWRNTLYQYVSGDWFLILSDDDYFIDTRYLSKAAALIRRERGLVLVYASGYIRYERSGRIVAFTIPFDEVNDGTKIFLSRGTVFPQEHALCNILFRTASAKGVDCFSNPHNLSCDSELFLLLALRGRVGVVKDRVSVYCVHAANTLSGTTTNRDFLVNNWLSIINPFLYARDIKLLAEDELALFERRALLPTIRASLLSALKGFPADYQAIREKLAADVGQAYVDKATANARFLFYYFLIKDLNPVYLLLRRLKKMAARRL